MSSIRLGPRLWLFTLLGCGEEASSLIAATMQADAATSGVPAGEASEERGTTEPRGEGPSSGRGSPGSSSETSGSSGSVSADAFELGWEDNFDLLDLERWQLMTHSWEGNLAQFASNAVTENGILELALSPVPDDPIKPFRGVELRSRETLTFGKIEASARFAVGSGVVSSLVLIYTPWPPPDWNELDIEVLGKNTNLVQFNHMINIPPADPATGHLQFPRLVTLDFNPTDAFHTYTIEWVPGEARFFIDGVLYHTATEEMDRMVLPQNILLTIWASNAVGWAGPIDSTTAPTTVEYDWIRVYRWSDSRP